MRHFKENSLSQRLIKEMLLVALVAMLLVTCESLKYSSFMLLLTD